MSRWINTSQKSLSWMKFKPREMNVLNFSFLTKRFDPCLSNHLNLMNCWCILHKTQLSHLFFLWCCQVGVSADTRSPVEGAESRDNLSEPRSKFFTEEVMAINRERSWSKSPTREFVKNFPWDYRKHLWKLDIIIFFWFIVKMCSPLDLSVFPLIPV